MIDVSVQPELYCVIEPDDADELLEAARSHFAPQGVNVIVERRDERSPVPFDIQHQRALHLPRTPGAQDDLPEELAENSDRLRLVQRMPAPGLVYADDPLLGVVAALQAGDGVAASELVWRIHARVSARLVHRHGNAAGEELTDAALGRVLDRIGTFAGRSEPELLRWLDSVVDTV